MTHLMRLFTRQPSVEGALPCSRNEHSGGKEEWIENHERIEDEYLNGFITEYEARQRFRGLGLDEGEIIDILNEIDDSVLEAAGTPYRAVGDLVASISHIFPEDAPHTPRRPRIAQKNWVSGWDWIGRLWARVVGHA